MAGSAGLQRGAGVSLWRQIADRIRLGIAADLADRNGRLPPETELAERFGVNRHTVRAAISALAYEGVLHAEQGRGTYVRRQKRFVYPIREKTRFSAGLEGQGHDLRSELLSHQCEAAPPEVTEALGLSPDEETVRLEVLGSADGTPVSRATSWFGVARFPDIADHFARTGSITEALMRSGIADYSRASTAIEARHADEADTRELRLSPGAIVLFTRALNVDPNGAPIQYSLTRFAADRMTLLIQSQRPAGAGGPGSGEARPGEHRSL
jgi:GntR family phosphonate transport system transcriptional regulator